MTAALDNRAAAALRKRRRGALGRSLRRHWQLYALLVLPVTSMPLFCW